jgi:predicted lipoprotein
MLKKMFGHEWEEENGQFNVLYKEELCDFCKEPSIDRVMKCRILWQARYLAWMRVKWLRILMGNVLENDHLEE